MATSGTYQATGTGPERAPHVGSFSAGGIQTRRLLREPPSGHDCEPFSPRARQAASHALMAERTALGYLILD